MSGLVATALDGAGRAQRRWVAAVLLLALWFAPGAARANAVTNPFFTGTATSATGWTVSVPTYGNGFNSPLSTGAPSAVSSAGSTEFQSGCVGAACLTYPFAAGTSSGAQQTISTVAGTTYSLSFWVYFGSAATTTAEIDVYWGSTRIYAGTNVAATGWYQQTLSLGTATTSSTVLTVMIRDDPAYSAITALDIEIVPPTIAVTKTKTVVTDPVNSTTNPKAIPGATVQYCLQVTNSGSGAAAGVTITDPLPAQITFVAGSVKSGSTCASATTSGGGSVAGGTLTGTIGALAPASSAALTYLATVN